MHVWIQKGLSEGAQLSQLLFDESIQIHVPLEAGHYRPASETPLNGVSLAGEWWPNIECWLVRGDSGPPCPSSGSEHGMGRQLLQPFRRAISPQANIWMTIMHARIQKDLSLGGDCVPKCKQVSLLICFCFSLFAFLFFGFSHHIPR